MEKQGKTFRLNKKNVEDRWFVVDAAGKTLGRLSTEIAMILKGKHKVDYTPEVECGDGVIVINCEQVVVTGSKEARKIYRHYTGHIGGMVETPYRVMKQKKPDYIIRHAVSGMMPKTKQAKHQLRRLRIFVGAEHDMQAQRPLAVA
jgi:large subunit ribosomal protein L13